MLTTSTQNKIPGELLRNIISPPSNSEEFCFTFDNSSYSPFTVPTVYLQGQYRRVWRLQFVKGRTFGLNRLSRLVKLFIWSQKVTERFYTQGRTVEYLSLTNENNCCCWQKMMVCLKPFQYLSISSLLKKIIYLDKSITAVKDDVLRYLHLMGLGNH